MLTAITVTSEVGVRILRIDINTPEITPAPTEIKLLPNEDERISYEVRRNG